MENKGTANGESMSTAHLISDYPSSVNLYWNAIAFIFVNLVSYMLIVGQEAKHWSGLFCKVVDLLGD